MKVGDLITWKDPTPLPELVQIGVITRYDGDGFVWIQWCDSDELGHSKSVEHERDLKVIA